MKNFSEFGIQIPDVLLPARASISRWSVIACDQYTQDASYWDAVAAAAGGGPSTLRLILPEAYLGAPDKADRIRRIRSAMREYLAGDVFAPEQKACIYIERKTQYGRTRRGLLVALDLEAYDWHPGTSAPVRATEATIVERIPPRKEIRDGAPLESPHIMLLANDPEGCLVDAVGAAVRSDAPVYDGDLMLGAGHVTGWTVRGEAAEGILYAGLARLKAAGTAPDGSCFLFAVGDGNHSLATAKAVWEEHKARLRARGVPEAEVMESRVRYALVEVVSLFDAGLTFEPIHRVLLGAEARSVAADLRRQLGGLLRPCESAEELAALVRASGAAHTRFGIASCGGDGRPRYECLETSLAELAVSRLQPALDAYLAAQAPGAVAIDYIHGTEEVFRLGRQEGAVALLLPPIAKDSFFATISSRGPLPRKSFSMGEASEKRFYLECRRLFD